MAAPVFTKCEEITQIIDDLLSKRADLFGEMSKFVFSDMFEAALRSDKGAPENADWILKVEGIRGAKSVLTDKKYLIYGFKDKWDACQSGLKVILVCNMLDRVAFPTQEELDKLSDKGLDYEYGQIVQPDIKDRRRYIERFGVNYQDEGSTLPNPLEDHEITF